jgi:hypothetical protein
MKIEITENSYNKFTESICRVENSPIRDNNSDFWDIFSTKEADISNNDTLIDFIKSIDTQIYKIDYLN